MAHFRGTIEGQRGPASRLGSAKSGLTVKANGWDFGVTVYLVNHSDGDKAFIWLTGGSNCADAEVKIGMYTPKDLTARKAS